MKLSDTSMAWNVKGKSNSLLELMKKYILFFNTLSYICRSSTKLQRINVEVLRQNFVVQLLSSLIWTILPREIRNVKSSNQFKKNNKGMDSYSKLLRMLPVMLNVYLTLISFIILELHIRKECYHANL